MPFLGAIQVPLFMADNEPVVNDMGARSGWSGSQPTGHSVWGLRIIRDVNPCPSFTVRVPNHDPVLHDALSGIYGIRQRDPNRL